MIWNLFRKPASFTDTPRLTRYTIALKEHVHDDLTSHWRGQYLMTIAATDEEDAKRQALDKARRYGVLLRDDDVIEIRGGRQA